PEPVAAPPPALRWLRPPVARSSFGSSHWTASCSALVSRTRLSTGNQQAWERSREAADRGEDLHPHGDLGEHVARARLPATGHGGTPLTCYDSYSMKQSAQQEGFMKWPFIYTRCSSSTRQKGAQERPAGRRGEVRRGAGGP